MEVSTNPLQSSAVGGNSSGGLAQATQESMGREDFLKLLMAQLEQQDPMNPLENHEFVAQLATFSSLEQQVLANDRLEELALGQMSSSNAQLSGLMGESITARGDAVHLDGDTVPPIGLDLARPAATVTITVKDSTGSVVHQIERKNMTTGVHSIDWAGTAQNGSKLRAGDYKVEIEAKDEHGNGVTATTIVSGTVDSITFERGYPELLVGGRRIKPADILSIGATNPSRTRP